MPEMHFRFQFDRRLARMADWETFNHLLDHDGQRCRVMVSGGQLAPAVVVAFDDGTSALIFNSELQAE